MPISNELFFAILSMDSYNRGYEEGISNLGGIGTTIGTASILDITSPNLEDNPAYDAGFNAVAYNWNDSTVVSFRGTDFATGEWLRDVVQGWAFGDGGFPSAPG